MKKSRSGRKQEHEGGTRRDEKHHEEHDLDAHAPDASGPEFYSDVDDASEASFPASDPPAWMGIQPGGPERS